MSPYGIIKSPKIIKNDSFNNTINKKEEFVVSNFHPAISLAHEMVHRLHLKQGLFSEFIYDSFCFHDMDNVEEQHTITGFNHLSLRLDKKWTKVDFICENAFRIAFGLLARVDHQSSGIEKIDLLQNAINPIKRNAPESTCQEGINTGKIDLNATLLPPVFNHKVDPEYLNTYFNWIHKQVGDFIPEGPEEYADFMKKLVMKKPKDLFFISETLQKDLTFYEFLVENEIFEHFKFGLNKPDLMNSDDVAKFIISTNCDHIKKANSLMLLNPGCINIDAFRFMLLSDCDQSAKMDFLMKLNLDFLKQKKCIDYWIESLEGPVNEFEKLFLTPVSFLDNHISNETLGDEKFNRFFELRKHIISMSSVLNGPDFNNASVQESIQTIKNSLKMNLPCVRISRGPPFTTVVNLETGKTFISFKKVENVELSDLIRQESQA